MQIPNGTKFGLLVVLALSPEKGGADRHRRYHVRCVCGREYVVSGHNLKNGQQSCGCTTAELLSATARKHGLYGHALHRIWTGMRTRCNNPRARDYARYGGRGITICERWNDFAAFVQDMDNRPSPKHVLDRIDNDGPYAPENCRWVTLTESARNRRDTLRLTVGGVTRSLAEWSELTGLPQHLIRHRLKRGWKHEECLWPRFEQYVHAASHS